VQHLESRFELGRPVAGLPKQRRERGIKHVVTVAGVRKLEAMPDGKDLQLAVVARGAPITEPADERALPAPH
jgi:hypothetical protein